MTERALAPAGRIFISYRREDTAYPAGWLYDRLAEQFGEQQVFKDVDSIGLGDDFVEVITDAVGSCDVLLALIGPEWLQVAGPDGKKRLDNPEDFVRIEIEAALARDVLLIPILIDGTTMPMADELPRSIAHLARRQALELSPSRFRADTARLLDVVARTLTDISVKDASEPSSHELQHDDSIGNLPEPLTRLVGRDGEVKELSGLLASRSVRLVTLTGPGGSGKTRLAIESARHAANQFEGVCFVALATLTDVDLMPVAIGEAMGFPTGRHTTRGLVAEIGHKALLLVLDNLEQLEGAAAVVSDLLGGTDHLVILATSRRALHVPGGHEHVVNPLELPGSEELDAALASGAVQMFVQHAVMVNPTFELTPANVGHVVEVCRRLDGLPLALELAAARSKILTPSSLATRLDGALEFTQHDTTRPSHQSTLKRAIEWSFELLNAGEQDLFCRLGALSGGGDLDAIEAIARPTTSDPVDGLSALVDASLVTVDHRDVGEPRFGMLETIRTFAREILAADGQLESALRVHANHFAGVARRIDELYTSADSNDMSEGLRLFRSELENIRAVLRWTLGEGTSASVPELASIGIQVCASLREVWGWDGSVTETVHWMTLAVAGADDLESDRLADSFWGCYWALALFLPQFDGSHERAHKASLRCVELAHRLGDMPKLTESLILRARAEQFAVDTDAARATFAEAEQVAQLSTEWELQVVPYLWSIFEMVEGRLDRALELAEQDQKLAAKSEDPYAIFQAMHNIGRLSLLMGDADLAMAQLSNQLAFAVEFAIGDQLNEFAEDYGAVLAAVGEYAGSARVLGATEADRQRRDAPRHPNHGPRIDTPYDEARERVGAEAWERNHQEGLTMTVKEALESTR
jgi:predicted ATPase